MKTGGKYRLGPLNFGHASLFRISDFNIRVFNDGNTKNSTHSRRFSQITYFAKHGHLFWMSLLFQQNK